MRYLKWLFLGLTIALATPIASRSWTNYKEIHIWGPSVVRLLGSGGGGTGFQIKYQGKQYTLTNDHICDSAGPDKTLIVVSPYTAISRIKIIEKAENTDLCLLTPLRELPALELGSKEFAKKEPLTVLGHPKLRPLEARHGLASRIQEVVVMLGMIETKEQLQACSMPKNKVETIFFGLFQICTVRVRSQLTTAPIEPGNSGSPVLDSKGRVRGVAFASGQDKRAAIIPLSDMIKFLRHATSK